MNWQFYLEPILIILGQLLYDIEELHLNACLKWWLKHPEADAEYRTRAVYGAKWENTRDFWDDSVAFADKKYAEKNHTRRDVVLWYRMLHFWGLIINERWTARKR